jgi:hypothetical protein
LPEGTQAQAPKRAKNQRQPFIQPHGVPQCQILAQEV